MSTQTRVFRFLAQLLISLHRVSTTENEANIMTKIHLADRHRELCKTDFDLDTVPVARITAHAVLCLHAGWQSLGALEEVFSCSCATAQLLSMLACVWEVRTEFLPTRGPENEFLVVFTIRSQMALVRYDISCRCALNRIH